MSVSAVVSAVVAFALTAPTQGGVKADLQGIRKEIRQKQVLIRKTAKIEQKVSGELLQIDRTLREKQSDLDRLSADLRTVEAGLVQTAQETERVRADAERKRSEINRRLVSLYKAGEMGALRVIFSSDSLPAMAENYRYMQAVLQHDRTMVDDYNRQLRQLAQLRSKLEEEQRKKEGLKSRIEAKKTEIQQEKGKKTDYLTKVKQDKKTYLASLRELEANAKRLQAMMQRLEAMSRRSASATRPDKLSAGKQQEMTGYRGNAVGGRKGQLPYPVRGTVVETFGKHKHPEFDSYTFSNGISIAAPAGTDIHAVADGKVVYANYFRGYGNMVIIDHGNGFMSLYAHAAKVVKKEGTTVSKNDVVATVGDLDSARGPMLYFELRQQGKPVDPASWLR